MQRRQEKRRERGQVLILTVLVLVVIVGFTSMTIDIGLFLHQRRGLQNTVDASALAGAQELPDTGTNATDIAKQWAASNDSELDPNGLDISFRCLVGDRDNNGQPDLGDVPAVCDPGGAAFHCSNKICWAYCTFGGSNKCNTIVVGANKDVPFWFAPVLSVLGGNHCFFDECNTGAIRAAACRGACGAPPGTPLDLMMVIDRTTSLCSNSSNPCSGAGLSNLNNIKTGAKTVLQILNPAQQHVGLAVLPRSIPSNDCQSVNSNSAPGNWLITGLASDFNTNGVLNTSSELVSNVNCMQMAPAYGTQTDLGDPLEAAKQHLVANGRANATKAILFLTDGAANEPQFNAVPGNTGNLNCGAQAAATGGDNNGFQTNAAGACADGGANATDTDSGTNTTTACNNAGKDRHVFRDYNISLPANATITGIGVRLDAWVDATTGTRQMCADLSWNGGASWSSTQQTANLSASQATYALGGSSSAWGHTWVPADVSNGNFRLRINNVSSDNARDFMLDWASVNIYYTTPSPFGGSCQYANQKATEAKAADIEVFTIGFGIETETCKYDAGSPYNNATSAKLLADMATNSFDDHGHCANSSAQDAENADDDHFLCEAKDGSSLAPLFKTVVESLVSGSKLVDVYG